MSPLSLPRSLLLSTLSALVLLTASPARADLPSETIYLSRAEISDESLRGVIGVAFISSMTGPDQLPSGHLTYFEPEAKTPCARQAPLPFRALADHLHGA